MSSEHLSNLVVAVMKGEDATKETALTKEYPKPRMLSEGDKPVRCEFSLHEVLSGYARVTRLNGEEPKVREGEYLNYCTLECSYPLQIDQLMCTLSPLCMIDIFCLSVRLYLLLFSRIVIG